MNLCPVSSSGRPALADNHGDFRKQESLCVTMYWINSHGARLVSSMCPHRAPSSSNTTGRNSDSAIVHVGSSDRKRQSDAAAHHRKINGEKERTPAQTTTRKHQLSNSRPSSYEPYTITFCKNEGAHLLPALGGTYPITTPKRV